MEEKKGMSNTYEFSTKDFIKSFIGVVKTVVTKPSEFYQNMPTTGGIGPPVIFLTVCYGSLGLIFAIFASIIGIISTIIT